MVGGTVIGIARGSDDTLLHVEDRTYSTDRCSVRCVERRRDNGEPVTISLGDQVWWQSGSVMWTPAAMQGHDHTGCGVTWDVQLPKVGYSH